MLSPVANYSLAKVEPLYEVESNAQRQLAFAPGLTIKAGTVLAQISAASANEVQTLDFTGTWAENDSVIISITGVDGGTYSTADLALNATPAYTNANLKIALDALLAAAGYDGVTVAITNGPAPADTTITFGGTGVGLNAPLMTVASVTAGDGTVVIDATTAGNKIGLWVAYDDDGTDDGRREARAIAVYTFRTDNIGRVVYGDSGTSPENGIYHLTAPAWFKGVFKTTDLTGLDANGVADLGRLESGTVADGVLSLI